MLTLRLVLFWRFGDGSDSIDGKEGTDFVERALYSDAQGVVFAAGTNALATRLPLPLN